jgi:hypothetical protein
VLETADDPSFFEKVTDKKQLDYPDAGTRSSRFAWLEAYNARFPSKIGTDVLGEVRPTSNSFIGGNMTIIYTGKNK